MKRRNFIFCTALGVGSISGAFASVNNKSSVENNLQQYLSAIGAQGELKFFCDAALEKGFNNKSLSYLNSGYKSYGLKYYFCSKRSVAACPLVLSIHNSGIIDLAILFFRKDESGEWDYCNSYSGFHLESIVKALPELDQNYSADELSDLLVPVKSSPGKMLPYTLSTKNGALHMVVRIEDQKTLVDFSITQKNNKIFAKNCVSEHALLYHSLS